MAIKGPFPAGPVPGSPSPVSKEEKLQILADNLTEKLNLKVPFSGVIAFQVGDGPIVSAAHCPEQVHSFTQDQPFNVLSIGKLFTAVSVMQLIEDGVMVKGKKISLDTPLSDLLESRELDLVLDLPYAAEKPAKEFLKELEKHRERITLAHLLSHRAGFTERKRNKRTPSRRELGCRKNWNLSLF